MRMPAGATRENLYTLASLNYMHVHSEVGSNQNLEQAGKVVCSSTCQLFFQQWVWILWNKPVAYSRVVSLLQLARKLGDLSQLSLEELISWSYFLSIEWKLINPVAYSRVLAHKLGDLSQLSWRINDLRAAQTAWLIACLVSCEVVLGMAAIRLTLQLTNRACLHNMHDWSSAYWIHQNLVASYK